MTREERQELRLAALRAVARTTVTPWKLQTSNSFRRVGALGDGDVLSAVVHASDRQPDLLASPGVLDYIVAAQPCVVLELLGELDEAEGALNQTKLAIEETVGTIRSVLKQGPR